MKHSVILTILGIGLFCFGFMANTGVWAAGPTPCSEDIAKFCKDVKPGLAMMDCLEKNEGQLSDACKAYEAKMGGMKHEMREEVREQMRVRQACMGDMARFCNDIKPGSGGIMTCLKANEAELSLPCRDAVKAVGEEEKAK